jgi:hypothetical protein
MYWSEVRGRPLATPAFKNPGQGRSRAFSGSAHNAPARTRAGLNRPLHAAGRVVAVFRSQSCGHAAHADVNAAVDIHRAGKGLAIPWPVQGRAEPPMYSCDTSWPDGVAHGRCAAASCAIGSGAQPIPRSASGTRAYGQSRLTGIDVGRWLEIFRISPTSEVSTVEAVLAAVMTRWASTTSEVPDSLRSAPTSWA